MIISQTSTATGRLTCATVAAPSAWNTPGHDLAERDADDDAQRHPERQIALERCPWTALCRGDSDGFAHGCGLAMRGRRRRRRPLRRLPW